MAATTNENKGTRCDKCGEMTYELIITAEEAYEQAYEYWRQDPANYPPPDPSKFEDVYHCSQCGHTNS